MPRLKIADIIFWLKKPRNSIFATAAAITITSLIIISMITINDNNSSKLDMKSTVGNETSKKVSNGAKDVESEAETSTQTKSDTPNSSSTNSAQDTTQPSQPTTTSPQGTQQTPVLPTYSDTYPVAWRNQCDTIDTWGQTKCQSTSYAAWKVNEIFGSMPMNWGDASTWPAKADAAHMPRGTTPQLHSVGVVGNFNVFVEAINADNTIDVSYYNWNFNKAFGFKNSVPASTYSTYIYFSS